MTNQAANHRSLATLTTPVSYSNLFRMARNGMIYETQVIDGALASLESQLPPSWKLRLHDPGNRSANANDGVLELQGPNGAKATFVIEAKRAGAMPSGDLARVLAGLATEITQPLLFVSDYINPVLRGRLADAGISFADGTGWVRLTYDDPLIIVTGQGAERSPKPPRASTATTRLNGKAANRIIRTLLQEPTPLGVRELARLTDTSPGTVSKLLPTLVADGAVERDEAGAVTTVRRRALLRRWTADYSFLNSNGVVFDYIAPRGLDNTLATLQDRAGTCVTGSAAARTFLPSHVTPVVPVTQIAIYSDNPSTLASDLQLIRADRRTANIVVTTPRDPSIVAQPRHALDGTPTAPLGQVLADLLTLPGRSDQEAEQLMDALATNDPTWRN